MIGLSKINNYTAYDKRRNCWTCPEICKIVPSPPYLLQFWTRAPRCATILKFRFNKYQLYVGDILLKMCHSRNKDCTHLRTKFGIIRMFLVPSELNWLPSSLSFPAWLINKIFISANTFLSFLFLKFCLSETVKTKLSLW